MTPLPITGLGEGRGRDDPKTHLVPYTRTSSVPTIWQKPGWSVPLKVSSKPFFRDLLDPSHTELMPPERICLKVSLPTFSSPVALHILGLGKTGGIPSKSLLSYIPGTPLHFPSLPRAGIEKSPPCKSLLRQLWPAFTFLTTCGISFLSKRHKKPVTEKKMNIKRKFQQRKPGVENFEWLSFTDIFSLPSLTY